ASRLRPPAAPPSCPTRRSSDLRTRWGLRMRAVGEHPQAADTVGINVARTRYMNVLIAGAVAGMGGAFYTLVSVPRFNPEMTAGRSEEHTSELQSRENLVCRLLL